MARKRARRFIVFLPNGSVKALEIPKETCLSGGELRDQPLESEILDGCQADLRSARR